MPGQDAGEHGLVERDQDSRARHPFLYVSDVGGHPIGKRVDPGSRYLADDRFYVDALTDNPFEALELDLALLRER